MGATDLNIEVYETSDEQEILHVLASPAIVETIKEDGGLLSVHTGSAIFVAAKVNDELASVWIFNKTGAIEIDVHAHILPDHRPHSLAIGKHIFKHLLNIAPWALKFTAQIPHKYPNVYAYAKKLGFQDEGVNRGSYLSNGEVFDQWHLGALRSEIKHELD